MDRFKKIQELIDELLNLGFDGQYEAEYTPLSDTELKIDIGGDEVSYLIGQYGRTLLALQHIIRQMYINNTGDFNEEIKIIIDVDGYKQKRVEKIKDIARNAAEKSVELDKEVTLPAMNPFERHVVHEFIQEAFPGLGTGSVGEEPNRRVVLKPGQAQKIEDLNS
jgi:spoIIIJ-associated protein